MRIVFIVPGDFPHFGACVSLLKNLLYRGGLAEQARVEVVSLNSPIAAASAQYDGVWVHPLFCGGHASVKLLLSSFWRHPGRALRGFVDRARYKLWFKRRDGEVDPAYASRVRRLLEKLSQKERIDVLVPMFGSFEGAAGALCFQRAHPETHLALYQVDPCATNACAQEEMLAFRRRFENELYTLSSVIFTTPILLEEMRARYPSFVVKKAHALEFPNVVVKGSCAPAEKGPAQCLFAGNIYGTIRDPRYTLRLFEGLLPEAQLSILGEVSCSDFCEQEYPHVCFDARLPLAQAQERMLQAHVLVNIGNSMLNQVPSKLFEYISYGKPIVNICKNRTCPTLSYLEKYPYVLNLYEQEELLCEQRAALLDFVRRHRLSRVSGTEIERLYETCTPAYCAAQMLSVFAALCPDGGEGEQ